MEPIGRRILPVKSPLKALVFGLIWGWLPCGLVYSTIIWAASFATASQAALLMLAFGLGTLPTTLFAGFFSGWLSKLGQVANVKKYAGTIIIFVAVISMFFALDHDAHKYIHLGDYLANDH